MSNLKNNQRPIDKIAEEHYSLWGKSFVFIKKTQIKSWQAIFIIAFVSGLATALIWVVAMDIQSYSKAAPSANGLVGYYTFDEGTGGMAGDTSGNANNGRLDGATWMTDGKLNGALYFNGSNAYVESANSSSLNLTGNSLTISVWVNYQNTDKHQIFVAKPFQIGKDKHISPYFAYSLHGLFVSPTTIAPRFYITTNEATRYIQSSQNISINSWHHIAGVYDGYGKTIKIYVDGVERGSYSASGNLKSYSTPLLFGNNGGFTEPFKGKLDDVRIYNRALSQSEISALKEYTGVDFLQNRTFESFTGGKATNWSSLNDSGTTYTFSQDIGNTGLAQKINVTKIGNWGLILYQQPRLTLGKTYTWTFWYKTSGTNPLGAQVSNGPHTAVVFSENLPGTNGTWQQVTRTFVYNNSSADMVRVATDFVDSYWIDDMNLVEGGTVTSDNYTVTPVKAGTGTGTVTCNPTSCVSTSGSVVTLTATLSGGSTFAGWSAKNTSTNAVISIPCTNPTALTCTFTPNANTTVTATMNGGIVINPTVTISKSGTGTGTVVCNPVNCSVTPGSPITLTATPSASSTFTSWSNAGSCTTATACTFTPTADTTVTAIFTASINPTVTISANPTSVTSGGSSNITWSSINATACSVTKAGTAWQTGTSGTNVSSGALTANTTFTATCTGVMGTTPASASVTVTVGTPITYTITTSAGSNGSISPTNPSVSSGSNQTITITPNSGYQVASVLVDGVSVGAVTSYIFSNVTANHTISATFSTVVAGTNYYVRSGATGNGSGSDWNNAWSNLSGINWNSVTPGTTICVAGGTYSPFSVGRSGTAQARITIKRATANNECAQGAGWNGAYDSQVVIDQATQTVGIYLWYIDFVTIDGQVEHGIKIAVGAGTPIATDVFGIRTIGDRNEFKNLYIVGPRVASNRRGITAGTYLARKNGLIISRVEIEGLSTQLFLAFTDNILVEYSKFHSNAGNGTYHDNIAYISNDNHGVWRFNEQWDYSAEGLYFQSNCASMDDWKVYGNIFRDTSGSGRGIEFDPDCYTAGGGLPQVYGPNWFIYNNVFANLAFSAIRSSSSRPGLNGVAVSGGQIYNNIFYNNGVDIPGMTHNYNWFSGASNLSEANGIAGGSTNPFSTFPQISSTIGSQYPRNKGTNLGVAYAIDGAGNTRGSDGTWDIGAYEYTGGGTPLPTATLSASPTSVTLGQSSILTWSSTNATSCTGTGGTFAGTGKATAGTQTVTPTITTTYGITCTGTGGTSPTASVTVGVGPVDTTPPSAPTGLSASSIFATQATISWTASTDNVAVAGYKIFRNGSQVGTSNTTSFTNTGLVASTNYSYTVSAYDSATPANVSVQSSPLLVTTLAQNPGGGRGRAQIQNGTVVADNGSLLRGDHLAMTTWNTAHINDINWYRDQSQKYHFNAVRLLVYQEPVSGGCMWETGGRCITMDNTRLFLDTAVAMTRDTGLYAIIDYHPVCNYYPNDARTWWDTIAPRYKDYTHVIYEVTNEPVCGDMNSALPTYEQEMYTRIRNLAPNTNLIMWSVGVLTNLNYENMRDTTGINYSNATAGFHYYGLWMPLALQLKQARPAFMTEAQSCGAYGEPDSSCRTRANDVAQDYVNAAMSFENNGISWILLKSLDYSPGTFNYLDHWVDTLHRIIPWPLDPYFISNPQN